MLHYIVEAFLVKVSKTEPRGKNINTSHYQSKLQEVDIKTKSSGNRVEMGE